MTAPLSTSADFAAAPGFRERFGGIFRALGRLSLDTLYPPTCLACRAATGEADALCPACWRAIRFIERPFCERLGAPFAEGHGAGVLSPQAVAASPAFGRARGGPCAGDRQTRGAPAGVGRSCAAPARLAG